MNTLNEYSNYILPFYAPANFVVKKASGSIVWDTKNKKYIDFTAGIATTNLGHSNKLLSKIINEQTKKLWHLSPLYINEPAVALAKKLCKKTFAEKVFFCNSGAEAIDGSVKIARKYGISRGNKNKNQIISFSSAFHGRLLTGIALSNSKSLQDGFHPLPKGIKNHPYNQIDGLEEKFSQNTCAVVIELVQWQDGIISANKKFITALKKLCKKYDALLIVDEVQSGMGRTGTLFSYEKYGFKPDLMCFAKGLANGFPIGGILTNNKISDAMTIGCHGTTFGGGPIACAIGCKVLDLIEKKTLLNNVFKKEKLFLNHFNAMNDELSCFKDIKSSGLWISLELNISNDFNVDNLIKKCHEKGLMILKANNTMIRISPSLIIENELIVKGNKILKETILELQ
jgi:predicted acetylornithine/succinylornithine family transaminase